MDKKLREALDSALWRAKGKELREQRESIPQIKTTEEEKREFAEHLQKRQKNRETKHKTAALIIALMLVLLTSSAVIFREEIGGFFISFFEDHANFDSENTTLTEIDVYYEPTYISEGYSQVAKEISDWFTYYSYENKKTVIIFRQTLLSNGGFNFDTENAEHGSRMIGETEVYYTIKKSTVTLVWRNETCSFLLMCPDTFSWEEIERIVTGIKPTEAAEE